jgi:DNA-binding transcriptional LysR family regulator
MRRLQAIVRDEEFTPGQCQERFRVAMNDHGSTILLPALLQRLRQEAPQSELVVSAPARPVGTTLIVAWHEVPGTASIARSVP